MKKIVIILILGLIIFDAYAADKQETAYERVMRTGTIRCGYSPWPSYFDVDPNTKELTGMTKDLTDAIFKILDIKVEYVEYVFSNKVIDLQSGRLDAICGDGPWILTTLKQVDYTVPYYYSPVYVYGRSDEKRFAKPADMNDAGIVFVGIDSDLSTDLVQKNFPLAKLQTLPSTVDAGQMLLDVAGRKADLVLLDPGAATGFIKNNPGKVRQIFPKPLAAYPGGFSVKKGEIDLLNMLNGGVQAALNLGTVDMILDKYDPEHKKILRISSGYQIK
jgi:ABC-type amino acid transport substrate-binding protein